MIAREHKINIEISLLDELHLPASQPASQPTKSGWEMEPTNSFIADDMLSHCHIHLFDISNCVEHFKWI